MKIFTKRNEYRDFTLTLSKEYRHDCASWAEKKREQE